MMFDLTGHVAMITGGNGGLGLSMAKGLVKSGASVALWGRNADKNAVALAELEDMGASAAAFACDVTDGADIADAMAATLDRFGRVDSCFANAGGSGARGPFHKITQAQWQESELLNVGSVVMTFQAAIGHYLERKGGGKLVVTSSIAAVLGMPMGEAYSATKASVTGLVRSLAIEYGRANIQANAILPGYIETELSLDTPQMFRDACLRRAAAGHVGTLADMEGIAVFLAAPESRFVTGQSIVIDGGHSIHPL